MKPILRTALVLVAALVVAAAVPIVRHAWAASCPASAGCNNFSTFWATFTYLVTGGTTARSDADRQVDEGMNVFDAGVDCTGGSDSTTAFQNAVNAMPDGGTLWFPVGCRMKLSSTITIRSRANVAFRSTSPGGVGSCNGKVPQILWTASGGTVFDFEYVDVPWIDGLSFLVSGASAYANTFLNYDRSGSNPHHKTGTAGRIYNSCFSNASNTTSDFAAIYIAPTTGDNEEDFIVDNISVSCSISESALRSRDGSIGSSSTTMTSATANFVNGDAGKAIFLSYPGFFLQTTIASVRSATTIVLTTAPSITQSNVTIHTGQSYGYAIHVGNSANSLQHQFRNIGYFRCNKAIYMENGSADMHHISGGQSNYGVYINTLAQNTTIDFYEFEDDQRGIELVNAAGPVLVTNTRMQNGTQFGDGFVRFSGSVILMSSEVFVAPPANTVLIGANGNPHLTSIGNLFTAGGINLTWSQIGYNNFGLWSPTTINDNFDPSTGSPHNFGCFVNNTSGNQPASCVSITGNYGHQNSTSLVINSINYFRDSSYYQTDLSASHSASMTKITADAVAPGAALSRIETVCGTKSGTAKIVVYAGTSTTPTTLLDNIGRA